MSCIKIMVAFVALIALSLQCARADENALRKQCEGMQRLTKDSFPTDRKYELGSFWENPQVREAYVEALHDGAFQGGTKPMNDARRAAVLLAAIVRRDLPLMDQSFNRGGAAYLEQHNAYSPITMSAMCNFPQGVELLVKRGADANSGNDLGAFNSALIYENGDLANYLLVHGYSISANTKRCKSSKYILNRQAVKISSDIASKIQQATCGAAEANP